MRGRLTAFLLISVVIWEATALGNAVPQEVDKLLPYACPLWQTSLFSLVGDQALFIGVADVNGDGVRDAVFAGSERLLVLIGKGEGTYEEEFAWGVYPKGSTFLPICGDVADLDGDGWPDVLVAVLDTTEKAGHIWAFRNWQGIFEMAFSITLPFTVSAPKGLFLPVGNLWIRDLNSDGKMDLVLVGGDPGDWGVYGFHGEGDLSWREPIRLAPAPGRCFAFEDFDGDGKGDLGFYSESEITILYGDGGGGFLPEVVFRPLVEDERIRAVAAADMDGDGQLDLVFCLDDHLLVAFQKTRKFQVGARAEVAGREILVRDFNGDGAPDALVGMGHLWQLVPGDGKGGLCGVVSEYLIWETEFAAADINGDGSMDFCSRGPSAQPLVLPSGPVPKGESHIPFDGNALLAVGDLSGDGAAELVTWSRTGMEALWNNGQGGLIRTPFASINNFVPVLATIHHGLLYCLEFESKAEIVDGKTFEVKTTTLGTLSIFSSHGEKLVEFELGEDPAPGLVVADLDVNGIPDVLCPLKNALVAIWDGVELQRYPWEKGELTLVWASDASPQKPARVILVSTEEYPEIWEAKFSQRELVHKELLVRLLSVPLAVTAADFDGDGRLDPLFACLVFMEKEGKLATGVELVLVLSGSGPTTHLVQPLMGETPWPLNGVAAGDFTGDGLADLAISVVSGRGCFLLPGQGDGTFGEGGWVPMAFHFGLGPIFGADLDGNGQEEIIASTSGLAPHIWVLWNGGGR